MKIRQLEEIQKQFGNRPIADIIEEMKGDNIYECPKCKGKGTERKLVRQGDYGYTDDEYKDIDCPVCKGIGFTNRKMKPKVVTEVVGYEYE